MNAVIIAIPRYSVMAETYRCSGELAMAKVADLVEDPNRLRTSVNSHNADVDDLVKNLWRLHAQMKSGDHADDLKQYVEGLDAARSDNRHLALWLLSVSLFLDQMSPDTKDIAVA